MFFWGIYEMNTISCNRQKRITNIIKRITVAATVSALVMSSSVFGADTTQLPEQGAENILPVADPVDLFLSQSAFIGNSVGEGLTLYNNAMKKVPLGNATMLTRVSYSFYADSNKMDKFLPRLNGVPMRAKDAIKNSGASFVFICMGTNDLVGSSGVDNAYAKYQKYLADIMTENPGVLLFIESCTPTRPGSNVNNDKVTAFNAYMQAYCDMFPNMFYVDIATPLKDGTGYLAANLSSDGSVHLTNKAYAIWADTVRAYITNFLLARSVAIREEHEKEYAKAQQNYRAQMSDMEQKKKEIRNERLLAEYKQAAAEKENRRQQLLNVPDDATLMRILAETKDDEDHPRIVGVADLFTR